VRLDPGIRVAHILLADVDAGRASRP
jgi:hypothetical protein